MRADHLAAVKARLSVSRVNVYLSTPTAPTYPYVVLYPDSMPRESDRLADGFEAVEGILYTVVVGVTEEQCGACLDRVSTALTGWRPTLAGRLASKIRNVGSQPVRKDDSLPDKSLFIATDQWRVASVDAS